MSDFFFANPPGLWALAALAAVAVLYLFYRRYRPLPVTGLFLWGVPRRDAKGGRKVQNPLLGRSFLLDAAAAGLLALALAGPALRSSAGLPLALVVDDSFAMRSGKGHEEAARLAERLLNGADRRGVQSAVILAGPTPVVLAGMGTPSSESAALVAGHLPSETASNLQAAVLLARDLYGPDLDLHVITNRDEVPAGGAGSLMTAHVIPGKGGNLAFSRVWRERLADSPDRERLVLAVVNHADAAVSADLTVSADAAAPEAPLYAEKLSLGAGETGYVEIALSAAHDATLIARLSGGPGRDVIAEDSLASIPPSPRRIVTYGFAGLNEEDARYFRLALEAAGCRPPSSAPAGGEAPVPDLLVTNNPERKGRTLTLEMAAVDNPGVFNPPYVADLTSPLCRDVNLSAVPWVVANRLAPADAEQIYIFAGDMPLFWRSRPDRLHLNLLPERCPIVRDPAWPALVANIVADAAALMPGIGKALYRPGETVRFRVGPGTGRGLALYAGGREIKQSPSGREFALPKEAGLYSVRAASGESGEVVVLPLYGNASDTTGLAPAARTARTGTGGNGGGVVDLTWLALGLGAAALGLNWWLGRSAGGRDE